MADEALLTTILNRIDADPGLSAEAGLVVFAAVQGEAELNQALANPAPLPLPTGKADHGTTEPPGAYLGALKVAGFRGIGPESILSLTPGPGLTLVLGRNGSGKSSFAEALEFALTGDNYRWAERTQVWRDGWCNLHNPTPRIRAEVHIDGVRGRTSVDTTWSAGADLYDAEIVVQRPGETRTDLDSVGWTQPMQIYRPFLSYNELGALLAGRPSELYDALACILGLDDLAAADKRLANAHRWLKDTVDRQKSLTATLRAALESSADERAITARRELSKRQPDPTVLTALLDHDDSGVHESALATLRWAAALETPEETLVLSAVEDLRTAAAECERLGQSDAGRARSLAALLSQALEHHVAHGDEPCPVCGAGSLDATWHAQTERQIAHLRRAAEQADAAAATLRSARHRALALLVPPPARFGQLGAAAVDAADALAAWSAWYAGHELDDAVSLAAHLEAAYPPYAAAVDELVTAAKKELVSREDVWRPLADGLRQWLDTLDLATSASDRCKAVKDALTWLKTATDDIRNDRLRPIAEQAAEIWRELRQESSVELGPVRLSGTGTRRHISLDVSVDGIDSAALSVMSQGELHALALSLFLPRATLPESPFRFLVIDDPVQAMDPSKVDGLARVLAAKAETRQVVVFTHDDRLAEAVRRQQIPARILEVTRREKSVVEVKSLADPVERYLADARAIARTEELPETVAQRVLPALCRLAIEAACTEVVRRVRIGRGDRHTDVEDVLREAQTTNKKMALALFGTADRTGDVLARLASAYGSFAPTCFRAVQTGSHVGYTGNLSALVEDTKRLCEKVRQ